MVRSIEARAVRRANRAMNMIRDRDDNMKHSSVPPPRTFLRCSARAISYNRTSCVRSLRPGPPTILRNPDDDNAARPVFFGETRIPLRTRRE